MAANSNRPRVLLVDDDRFARLVVGDEVRRWADLISAHSIPDAIANLEPYDPDVVVSELNFSRGPSGLDLHHLLAEEYPHIARVLFSSQSQKQLSKSQESLMPPGTGWITKAEWAAGRSLQQIVLAAIAKVPAKEQISTNTEKFSALTGLQLKALELLSQGKSDASIAKNLGITIRAAESLVNRTLASLQIQKTPDTSARVVAARVWIEAKVGLQ